MSEYIHGVGCKKFDGLCGMFLTPKAGTFRDGTTITLGARADSYYEYLLKQWLQTGKTVDWLRQDFLESMDGLKKHLWRHSEPHKFGFVGELLSGVTFSPKMVSWLPESLKIPCLGPSSLLPGRYSGLGRPKWSSRLAPGHGQEPVQDLLRDVQDPDRAGARDCLLQPVARHEQGRHHHQGQSVSFLTLLQPLDAHSLLRPEAFEAWFYMYRVTGDKMYQEWGWQAFQAIEKHARVEHGYSSVNNCKKMPVTYR